MDGWIGVFLCAMLLRCSRAGLRGLGILMYAHVLSLRNRDLGLLLHKDL